MALPGAVDRHIELIRSLSSAGGPMTATAATATVNNGAWFRRLSKGRPMPRASRAALHMRLVEERVRAAGPAGEERRAVVLAGPPGAGKRWVRRHELDLEGFFTADPDEFKALRLGRALTAARYRVTVIDVEAPFEVSQASIRERYREGYERTMAGEDTLCGRWVPSEYVRSVFNAAGEPSKPELAAKALAEQCPAVTEYRLYRGKEVGGQRQLETRLVRTRPGTSLLPA
jgi:hypothetical protein